MNVGSYSVPANVAQPGTSRVLDALDARLTQAVARADPAAGSEAVWTQHTVAGSGGRAVARWYELLPASDSVRQQGSIQDPNHSIFNAAISPANDGSSAAIFYNIGSGSLLAQIRAKSRIASTALGGMGGELTLGTSSAADQDFSCAAPYGPPCRWGDYAGASPDPVNQDVVWGSNQLNGPFTSDPHWVTRNFAVVAGEGTGYVRPKGATLVIVSLVPAQAPCSAANRTHGGGLPRPSCSPARQASPNVTFGTPDANGAAANGDGSVRLAACPVPGCAAPDMLIATDLTDLRCRPSVATCGAANSSGGADYTGQLQTALTLRVTDRYNGPSLGEAATMVDVPFPVTNGCSATATDATRGSTCSLVTTANSVVAGSIASGTRADVEVAQVQVRDGGSDGVVSTAGNSLFAVQGIFVP
jgi:hypothetical protein